MTSKRNSLCIDEKVLLIRAIETGEKISDVGRRFGFSRSTVATIWKNKEKILQAEKEGKSFKKLKKPKYEDLDQAILSWFHRQRQNNMPISGPIVKTKAKNFAEELGLTSFKASEGWLGKFKQRHNINYGKINGEARSVNTNVTHEWIDTVWSKLSEKYDQSDIFSADEAGFFYKLTPDKTLKFKKEKCVGGKLAKKRIAVLVAANMDGTEKKKNYDDLPLIEWMKQFNVEKKYTGNLQTYIEVDDCLLATTSLTDKEILDSVKKTENQEQGDEENEMDEGDEPESPPSNKEALESANLLEKYFLYHQDISILQDMNKIRKKIQQNYCCSKRHQTKIRDYTQ